MQLKQKQKEMLIRVLTTVIDSIHEDLCIEEIGDESAYLLSCHYRDLANIRNIIKGEDNEA